MAPDDALTADMRRKAEAIVAAAAPAYRDDLDFSPASLVALDAMLDQLFARRWPAGRGGRLDVGRYGAMIEPIGAYAGETLRRAAGGTWGVHEEHGPGLRLPSGMWTFPLAKAAKRFENGHADSLAFYAEVMAEMATEAPPPPGSTT